jgi:hypothetical protein
MKESGSHNDRRRRKWRTRHAASGAILGTAVLLNHVARLGELLGHPRHHEPPTISALPPTGLPPDIAEYIYPLENWRQPAAFSSGTAGSNLRVTLGTARLRLTGYPPEVTVTPADEAA